MRRAATLSDDGRFRWTLERQWGNGPYVCWVMLNPSTADAEVDDPTIRSIVERSEEWGFHRLVVVNLYPIRASDPQVARRWASTGEFLAEAKNRELVVGAVWDAGITLAAWGAAPWAAQQADRLLAEINNRMPGRVLYCLGTTSSGAPKHPLARGRHRVALGQKPVVWRDRETAA